MSQSVLSMVITNNSLHVILLSLYFDHIVFIALIYYIPDTVVARFKLIAVYHTAYVGPMIEAFNLFRF